MTWLILMRCAILIKFFISRDHTESMKKLKKLLSVSSKVKRRHQTLLNISITIFAWLVEFLAFFIVFLGSFILGYESTTTTLFLQTFSFAIYYVICPSVFLMNSFEMKTKVVENPIYQAMINRISCCHKVGETNDDDDADPRDENEGNNEE